MSTSMPSLSSQSSSSSFSSVLPQNCLNVYELLRDEEEPCRVWLRDEMNQIPDPIIDSLFTRLIMSSPSSAVPQSGLTMSELWGLLEGEKVEVNRVLQGEMARLVNSLFEKLTNKLSTNWHRDGHAADRAQVANRLDQVESHQVKREIEEENEVTFKKLMDKATQTNELIEDCVKQEIKEEEEDGEDGQLMEIKEKVQDGDETRVIDIAELTEGNQGDNGESGENDQEEDGNETTNKEEIMEIKKKEEDGKTQINNTKELIESEGDDEECRSVENAPMETTPARPIGQSQVVISQSTRLAKRKHHEPQARNEVNNGDNESIVNEHVVGGDHEVDDSGEGTSRQVKRPRPSWPTTSNAFSEKQIIVVSLRCSQGCEEAIGKDELNAHMWDSHSISRFRCLVKDCGHSFDFNHLLRQHIAQSHQSSAQLNCYKCTKQFSSYEHMSTHNVNYHQLGHFQCSFRSCAFTGEYKQKVYEHYKQHKQILKCQHSDCTYETANASALSRHQRTHLGIKPYKCKWPQCPFSSTTKSGTIRHIQRIHFANSGPTDDDSQLGEPKDFVELVHHL